MPRDNQMLGANILSMDNDKLLEILPKLGIMMQFSSMAKANATRRNGIPTWQINNTISDMMQSLQVNQVNNTTGLLPMLQQLLVKQPALPAAEDPLDKIAKSLHALHKRNDSIDDQLKKINEVCFPK